MKRLSLLILTLTASVAVQAQIGYTYDAAGNRTGSNIVVYRSETDEESEDEMDNAVLQRYHVTAAPNPTRGYLQVQVLELQDDDRCILSVFDASGRKILSQGTSRVLTTLDLTSLEDGFYLLRVDVNDETTTIKIIKES